MCFFFFFSSRRRHTRLTCDWSSDVCSSDLAGAGHSGGVRSWLGAGATEEGAPVTHRGAQLLPMLTAGALALLLLEIGRGSCRGRGESSGGGGLLKKKKKV